MSDDGKEADDRGVADMWVAAGGCAFACTGTVKGADKDIDIGIFIGAEVVDVHILSSNTSEDE